MPKGLPMNVVRRNDDPMKKKGLQPNHIPGGYECRGIVQRNARG